MLDHGCRFKRTWDWLPARLLRMDGHLMSTLTSAASTRLQQKQPPENTYPGMCMTLPLAPIRVETRFVCSTPGSAWPTQRYNNGSRPYGSFMTISSKRASGQTTRSAEADIHRERDLVESGTEDSSRAIGSFHGSQMRNSGLPSWRLQKPNQSAIGSCLPSPTMPLCGEKNCAR